MADKTEVWRSILAAKGPVVTTRSQRAAIAYVVEIQTQIDSHTETLVKLSRMRRDAIRKVLDGSDMTQSEIAELLGLTRSRVSHILNS